MSRTLRPSMLIITTVPRDGMNDNTQTVYGPTNNWQTVGSIALGHTQNQFLERRNPTRTYRHSRNATLSLYLT